MNAELKLESSCLPFKKHTFFSSQITDSSQQQSRRITTPTEMTITTPSAQDGSSHGQGAELTFTSSAQYGSSHGQGAELTMTSSTQDGGSPGQGAELTITLSAHDGNSQDVLF